MIGIVIIISCLGFNCRCLLIIVRVSVIAFYLHFAMVSTQAEKNVKTGLVYKIKR